MKRLNKRLIKDSKKGNLDTIKYLVEHGADVNYADNHGDTALLSASKFGDAEIVKYLIQEGANINHADNYSHTALIIASMYGRLDITKLLIQEGADYTSLKDANNNNGETALIWASRNGNTDMVKYLIKEGADINHITNDGYTALILASRYGYLDIIKLLIDEGADINHITNDGWNALRIAAGYDNLETVKYLIQTGDDYTSVKDIPKIKPIIDNIVKEYSNELKTDLTNNYLILSKVGPQINIGNKVKSLIPKELLLKMVYEVPYQSLCSNINRNYPPLKLIALANILKVDYNLDISWLDLCDKIKNILYLML